jgi:hypothetical protein
LTLTFGLLPESEGVRLEVFGLWNAVLSDKLTNKANAVGSLDTEEGNRFFM